LPGRTIEVLPASPGTNNPVTPGEPAASARAGAPPAAPAPAAVPEGRTPARQSGAQPPYWPWLAGAALAGWLVALVLWIRARRHGRAGPVKPPAPPANAAPSRRQGLAKSRTRLRNACQSNDPKAARAALLDGATVLWPDAPPRGLSELAARFATGSLQAEIVALDRLLYDGNAQRGWDGHSACPVLEQALVDAAADEGSGKHEALPGLYPQHVAGGR